jgi:hypothetical protein
MSERKYRQRGYMDDDRDRAPRPREGGRPPRQPGRPAGDKTGREPRAPNLPGFQQTMRCARCGAELAAAIGRESTCPSCGADLHSCAQCSFFDPGSRFECMQPIPARVSPKDARNDCTFFEPRVKVERQTGSTRTGPQSARAAFDDLFKF